MGLQFNEANSLYAHVHVHCINWTSVLNLIHLAEVLD